MNFPPPTLRLLQDPYEFNLLLLVYAHFWPRNVLEIGSADGGTLWAWCHNGKPGLKMTAISLFSQELYKDPRPLFPKWEEECGCQITALDGSSHDPAILKRAAELGPYDWILIDGDHSEKSVRDDFENCLKMAAHPSVIVLHDIAFPLKVDLAVGPFWKELEECHATARFVTTPGSLGVGIIFVK